MNEVMISQGIEGAGRWLLWIPLFLFVVFSAIVVRQTHLMTHVLSVPIAGQLRAVSVGLLLFAIGMFTVSVMLL